MLVIIRVIHPSGAVLLIGVYQRGFEATRIILQPFSYYSFDFSTWVTHTLHCTYVTRSHFGSRVQDDVFETVAEPLIIHQYPKEIIEQKVSEVIAQVGLRDEHLRRYPHSFSGGQRQRIGIARSLIISPKVIICDEAVSALDVSVQAQIINLLKELQERYHYSYVFISHDMSVIRHICDRIAVMYAGRIVEFGTKDEVLNSPKHPYTEALLDAVPKISNRKSKGKRKILLGEPPDLSRERTGCSMFERCGYRIDACQITPMKLSGPRNQHLTACMRTKEIQLNGLNIGAKQP